MATLAEPKRKQKYGPDPRNTFWSNDESKFGFRMLESMGWKKGKGLGAKESGRTEHIKAGSRKNGDATGLGCSKKHADNWIAHQDDFNAILASLNKTSDASAASKPAETASASVGLEEKSKTSRSRVHYHKFLRGKDLSGRSAHELDCIFGRRAGQSSENSTPLSQSEANSDEDSSSSSSSSSSSDKQNNNNNNNKTKKDDLDKEAHDHGVTTVTSASSVQEYFARKMAELKQKREAAAATSAPGTDGEGRLSENGAENNTSQVYEITDCSENENVCEVSMIESDAAASEDSSVAEKRRKKKKKKKKNKRAEQENSAGQVSDEITEDIPTESFQESTSECEEQQPSKSKKKEKRKKKSAALGSELNDSTLTSSADESVLESKPEQEGELAGKKAKKRKSVELSPPDSPLQQISEITDHNGIIDESFGEPSSKKKKKNKKQKRIQAEIEAEQESHNSSILRLENDGKTRRRKSVRFSSGGAEVFMIPNKEDAKIEQENEETVSKKQSRKRKRQKADVEEQSAGSEEQETAPPTTETTMAEVEDSQASEDDEPAPKKKKRKLEGDVEVKRKKKSKVQKEAQEIHEEEPVESNPSESVSQIITDDVAKGTNEKEVESSASATSSERMWWSKAKQKIPQDQINKICRSFVHTNMSSVQGYGV